MFYSVRHLSKKVVECYNTIQIPKPEFYIAYIGTEKIDEELCLSKAFDMFHDNLDFTLELRVKVIAGASMNATLGGYFDMIYFMKNNVVDV